MAIGEGSDSDELAGEQAPMDAEEGSQSMWQLAAGASAAGKMRRAITAASAAPGCGFDAP